jgi:hypothetical protein
MSAAKRAAIVVCALLIGAVAACPAFGSSWELRQLPVGEPVHSFLQGVSCPSASLCVAAGENGAIASSTNPTGGSGAWQIVRPHDFAQEADSCRPPLPWEPEGESSCPSDRYLHRGVRAISCPSPGLCVAVADDGFVYSSTDPTGPAESWRLADLDGSERDTHLESVSCPDPGFCVAVSGGTNTAGKVLTSGDPTGPTSAWRVTQLDESLDLHAVSCLDRDFCLAVAAKGRILRSTNPGGGPAAWEEVGTPGGLGDLDAVSCVDLDGFLCLAGNAGGNILTTATPVAGAADWKEANGGSSVQITSISCASASRCAAVDNNGNVLVSTDPGGGSGRSWAISNLIPYTAPQDRQPPLNALFSASCPTVTLCVLVGASGRIFTNTDPFAVPSASGEGQPGKKGKRRRAPRRPRTTLVEVDHFHSRIHGRRFKAGFRFHANGRVRGFVCKRDGGPYRRCRSPLRYWVPVGRHVLRVRAIGLTGLRGPAAVARFVVESNPNFK